MDENTYQEPVLPLAEVITSYREDISAPIEWEIVPTAGEFGAGVDFAAGVLAVPLAGDSHSQRQQLQKLVELRVSPTDPTFVRKLAQQYKRHGITEGVLRAAEYARVSAITEKFAERRGLEREPDGSEKTTGKRLATANTPDAWDKAVEYTLRTFGTKAFDSFASGIRSVNPEWSERLRKLNKSLKSTLTGSAAQLGDTHPVNFGDGLMGPQGFQNALYAASVVRDYLSDGYKSPDDMKAVSARREEQRAQNYGKSDEEPSTKGMLNREDTELEDDLPDDFEFEHNEDDTDRFGKLRICDTLPLTVEISGYMHRKRKAMVSGRRIAYPSRMLTDPQRRVFGSKVKVKGGVVVIDISGSMSLSQSDIESIVEAAPAALILAYSDCNDDPEPNAWILADRGWRVRDMGRIGGSNNGVDGPALTWAIRHRKRNEPIVWVTDGQVTGMSNAYNEELSRECAKLVKKHQIIMIPSVEEAVKQFKSGRLINKPAGRVRSALLGKF